GVDRGARRVGVAGDDRWDLVGGRDGHELGPDALFLEVALLGGDVAARRGLDLDVGDARDHGLARRSGGGGPGGRPGRARGGGDRGGLGRGRGRRRGRAARGESTGRYQQRRDAHASEHCTPGLCPRLLTAVPTGRGYCPMIPRKRWLLVPAGRLPGAETASSGSHGDAGSWFAERRLPVLATWRRQGRPLVDFLRAACHPVVVGGWAVKPLMGWMLVALRVPR